MSLKFRLLKLRLLSKISFFRAFLFQKELEAKSPFESFIDCRRFKRSFPVLVKAIKFLLIHRQQMRRSRPLSLFLLKQKKRELLILRRAKEILEKHPEGKYFFSRIRYRKAAGLQMVENQFIPIKPLIVYYPSTKTLGKANRRIHRWYYGKYLFERFFRSRPWKKRIHIRYIKTKRFKKKKIRFLPVIVFRSVKNNLFLTLTSRSGKVLNWVSGGSVGFSGSKRLSPYAAKLQALKIVALAKQLRVRRVGLIIKGSPKGPITWALKALASHVKDTVPRKLFNRYDRKVSRKAPFGFIYLRQEVSSAHNSGLRRRQRRRV